MKNIGIRRRISMVLAAIGLGVLIVVSGSRGSTPERKGPQMYQGGFEVQVLVGGRPLEQYYANGRVYIEALKGAEYEIRIRNPLPIRVAVALSVDGLNSIDARRTSAWNASKWVIRPYETINIQGWQMSSERARKFYFTSEGDSYAAKLGKAANVGLIAVVFFKERERTPITIVPSPRIDDRRDGKPMNAPQPSGENAAPQSRAQESAAKDRGTILPQRDDEYAATGIGRSVQNDVRWINMELDPHAAAEVTLRYEYRSALVRLGVLPRPFPDAVLPRRERATGFEDRRFCPEP